MAKISIKCKKKPPKLPDVEPAEFKISQNAHNLALVRETFVVSH